MYPMSAIVNSEFLGILSIIEVFLNIQILRYYICMSGSPWPQTCGAGLQFDTDCNCCDYAENVKCSVSADRLFYIQQSLIFLLAGIEW